MANVLEELPKIQRKGAGGHRGSKYPLDEWFNGTIYELVRGTPEQVEATKDLPIGDPNKVDYSAKDSSIVNMLHTQASARDLKLKSVKTETGIAIVAFQLEANGNGKTEQTPEDKSTKK